MKTSTSLPISLHILINTDFLFSCCLLWKALVSGVDLSVYVHKFGRSLELEAWETHMIEHTSVNQKWCEFSSHSLLIIPAFLFPWVCLQINISIYCLFFLFSTHGDDNDEVRFLILEKFYFLFLVSIYGDNFFPV